MKLLRDIQSELKFKGNVDVQQSTRKFVPSAVKVYGIKMPVLNQMAQHYKEGGFELVELLWASGAFEERILSAKILAKIGRSDPDKTLKFVGKFSKDIADWAVCDTLGMQAIKGIVKTKKEELFKLSDKLSTSSNLWQRRLSLVLLEYFTRDKKERIAIMRIVKRLEADEEYYVKKAVTWIKRNFEKGR